MDVQDIDLDTMLRAPDWAKGLVLLALAALIGGAFWQVIYKPHQEQVEGLERKVKALKAQYKRKQRQVANLPALREQLDRLQGQTEKALEQLPDRSEVASLLVEVTRAGRSEGLTFELFRPKPEKPRDFYAELPVEVKVEGSYNAIGRFLAAAASLSRIVSVTDLSLSGGERGLVLECRAKTFRYLGKASQ